MNCTNVVFHGQATLGLNVGTLFTIQTKKSIKLYLKSLDNKLKMLQKKLKKKVQLKAQAICFLTIDGRQNLW